MERSQSRRPTLVLMVDVGGHPVVLPAFIASERCALTDWAELVARNPAREAKRPTWFGPTCDPARSSGNS